MRATGGAVDVVEVTGQLFFSVVFRPGDVPWRARHRLDGNEYQQAYDTNKADGYRLHNITSYARGGTVNYAAIWLKQAGPGLRAYHGRSAAQHDQLVDTNTKDGYHPVNVSVAAPTGAGNYAALWVNSAVGGWRSPVHPDAGGLPAAAERAGRSARPARDLRLGLAAGHSAAASSTSCSARRRRGRDRP